MDTENKYGKVLQESERQKSIALISIVSDDKSKYIGIVDEISEYGLRLTQIPAGFDDSNGKCTAVVLSPKGDLDILIQPCWIKSTNKGMYKTIGFKIHNPPSWWQEFIKELESGLFSFLLVANDSYEDV